MFYDGVFLKIVCYLILTLIFNFDIGSSSYAARHNYNIYGKSIATKMPVIIILILCE